MRRTKRLTAIEASRQILGGGSSSESSDSESEHAFGDENQGTEDCIDDSKWNFVNEGDDTYDFENTTPSHTGISDVFQLPDNASERIDFFLNLFLSDDLFELLCRWTNKKAELKLDQTDTTPDGGLPDYLSKWRPVTQLEMKKVFGILLCMRLNQKPEIRHYWSRNVIYKNEFFQDSRCLSRNRFLEIMRFLRFCDYYELNEEDNLRKIRPFLNFVRNKCKTVYLPQKQICVDESLLLYKGRIHFRRYIPTKRARYGILSYCLCESSSGYTWNIEIAAGRNDALSILNDIPEEARDFTFSEKIVVGLVHDLLHHGYHLFVDNFFSSVRLSEFLYERKTLITGTIRSFRGVPSLLKDKHVPPKSHAFCRKNEVLCVKSVDRKSSGLKTIYLVDTANKAETACRTRTLRGGIADNVRKSASVLSYNRGMGGVDLRDGSLHQYNMARKSFKWFSKLAIHLVHVMIRNSWIVFRSCGGTLDFLLFQERVIDILVLQSGECRRNTNGSGSSGSINPILQSSHMPKRLSPRPNKERPAKRCRICFQEGRRKETVFVCPDCPTCPGLCIDPCFSKFHTS